MFSCRMYRAASRSLHYFAQRSATATLATPQRPLILILRRNMAAAAAASSSSPIRVPGPVVSPSWLRSNYPSVTVLDGSWYMPNEHQDPASNFSKAHLPGARFFDLEACTSKEGSNADLPHMMPSAEQLSAYLSKLGIRSMDEAVVVYDGKGIFSAPRIRFTLRHFGLDNVAVLEGGIKAWVQEGGKTETGSVEAANPTVAAPPLPLRARAGEIHTMSEVSLNSCSDAPTFQLVDARTAGRFNGTEPEPRPGLSSGHVAGAKNVPVMNLLRTDAASGATVFKPVPELSAAFRQAGVDPASPQRIVASCGSGVTACVVLLGLELAGRKDNVGMYDGSWTEWALRGNKIETNKSTKE